MAEAGSVSGVVDHLFRHEAGKRVATLTRIFGTEHLALAEDVVQEALARALRTWPFHGVPENPSAWILRTSLNRAVAVANLHGSRAGLDAVAAIPHRGKLEGYYLLHAVLGELEQRLGRFPEAAAHFTRALALAEVPAERDFLEKKRASCSPSSVISPFGKIT